ncbi:MAG TPA: MBL fold metallo-hydrolase [Terriglobia bacterium]|jgi:glyoxylase-like metal-dependent hydrolase (beta-lactamase superfamily II)|nr:MBL fold metallo-hydrolase [Terriglobia bacterium]
MKLGDFEIHPLSDGAFGLDGGQMFGVVPKVLWEKKIPADSHNRIKLGLNCILVRTGRETVVIETGIGDKFDARFADIYAVDHSTNLPGELATHGLAPSDIDIVINSHLHFDHCGWNTRRDGNRTVPTFPRARYYAQRGEWEHALEPSERDRASYIQEFFQAAEPQTVLLDGDQEIVPGIRVQVTPGHTRDLQVVWIESGGERACFVSDLAPTTAHLAYPWIMSFDLYPLETLASKRRLLPELVRSQAMVIFGHDAAMPWARLAERDGRLVANRVEG